MAHSAAAQVALQSHSLITRNARSKHTHAFRTFAAKSGRFGYRDPQETQVAGKSDPIPPRTARQDRNAFEQEADHRAGAGRRRRARLRAYRHPAHPAGQWHRSRHRGRHLDRRGGRRLLCGGTSRHAGSLGQRPPAAQHLQLPRHPSQRLRPDRRQQACRATGSLVRQYPDR